MGEAGVHILGCDQCHSRNLVVVLATHTDPAPEPCKACGRERPTVHEDTRTFVGCRACERMRCLPCIVAEFLSTRSEPS